jgi:NTE family protein
MATRALVLGGGGPVGIAWESGLIAGLAEAGTDLSAADFILGTSAGSFVGALLAAGRTPAQVVAPYLGKAPLPASASQLLTEPPDLLPLMGMLMQAYSAERPQQEVWAEIGAWSLKTAVLPEEAFLGTYDHSLADIPADQWPGRNYTCTAIDAVSGEFVTWNKDSDVALRRAVASSSAVPGLYSPVTLNGRRYMDGGARSLTNADLAKGYDVVVIIAVSSDAGPEVFRRPLERELQILKDAGRRVVLISPTAECLEAFGPNLMDYRQRVPAAEAGLRQGRAGIESLRQLWG